jgi:hypothetical protein
MSFRRTDRTDLKPKESYEISTNNIQKLWNQTGERERETILDNYIGLYENHDEARKIT